MTGVHGMPEWELAGNWHIGRHMGRKVREQRVRPGRAARGSNLEVDMVARGKEKKVYSAVAVFGQDTEYRWHRAATDAKWERDERQ